MRLTAELMRDGEIYDGTDLLRRVISPCEGVIVAATDHYLAARWSAGLEGTDARLSGGTYCSTGG